jgi:hypothetical protein
MTGSAPVVIASNQSAIPVSGSVSIQANASVNVAQINGITTLMGNGITGTGSQRVTIASDNTAFAVNNTQQGTASQNVAQVNGITTLTGNGVTGTGSQRVTIASDNTAIAVNNTQQGTASQNVAQINGVTPLMGSGNTGTGSQRVTIATDNPAFAVNNTQQGTASQNVAQVNGITTLTGNGVTGTGSQRVTIASDNTAISVNNTQQGTASQNVAQINGVTPLMGSGNTGTGSQRVTIATDNPAFAVNATLQTGTNYAGYVNPDLTVTSANLTSGGNGTSFAISGMRYVACNITGNAASFVFKFQVSSDGGTTWTDTYMQNLGGATSLTATINGQYGIYVVAGVSHVRVVLNSITSGTFTYQYRASMAGNPFNLSSTVPGFANPPFTQIVAGSDGSNAQNLSTTAKGTQGAIGLAVQQLKDAGRTNIMLTIQASGAATSEGLATVTESRNGAATATFTSKTITSGKRIRFTSIIMEIETLGSGTAPQRAYLSLRVNTAGATIASSPLQGIWAVTNATALVKSGNQIAIELPDGPEYLGDGTATYGWTLTFPDWVTSTATVAVKITIAGYEY